jgi:hypothetical protein
MLADPCGRTFCLQYLLFYPKDELCFLWDICNPTMSLPPKPGDVRELHGGHRLGCCSDCCPRLLTALPTLRRADFLHPCPPRTLILENEKEPPSQKV